MKIYVGLGYIRIFTQNWSFKKLSYNYCMYLNGIYINLFGGKFIHFSWVVVY